VTRDMSALLRGELLLLLVEAQQRRERAQWVQDLPDIRHQCGREEAFREALALLDRCERGEGG
jgi:hypothetical protein